MMGLTPVTPSENVTKVCHSATGTNDPVITFCNFSVKKVSVRRGFGGSTLSAKESVKVCFSTLRWVKSPFPLLLMLAITTPHPLTSGSARGRPRTYIRRASSSACLCLPFCALRGGSETRSSPVSQKGSSMWRFRFVAVAKGTC